MLPETIIALCLGIGMAAACGFRVFVPMLVVGIAARTDLIPVSDGFQWVASLPAIIAFTIATALEIGAYYFPWLDNLLDSVSTPTAVVAGVLVSAAVIVEMPPMWKWSLAIIAGGGAAGTVKTGMTGLRLGSTATSGGLINPVIATGEWIASFALSILAVCLPILAAIVAILVVVILLKFAARIWARLASTDTPPT